LSLYGSKVLEESGKAPGSMRKVGENMRKFIPFLAAGVIATSGVAFALAGGSAVAASPKVVKPPITVSCTSGGTGAGTLFGTESNQLVVGCTNSSTKAKATATGSIVPDVATSTATVYWTDNTTTTESFAYAVGGTCPTYLGLAATTAVIVTATVTGGTAKLTKGVVSSSVNCLYSAGGDLFVRSAGPVSY
jgi:hypothetical protein